MTDQANCGTNLYWHNCYADSFDLIAPDSFAHPAKMAPALCFRILDHLKELGLLKDSDTILDPMGGTGLTAITAGAKGYRAITCELEEKFTGFQKQNKEYAERKLYHPLDWQIIQGDARRLSELLSDRGLITVSSPPYSEMAVSLKDRQDFSASWIRNQTGQKHIDYGTTPGQISALPDKPLKAITSPPYDGQVSASNSDPHPEKQQSTPAGRQYGHSAGQIGDEQSETYLSAMLSVYQEIAKVSDVLAIVLKNPTRNGKLRRLDLDTIELLKQSGWSIHCQHRALLFEELEQGKLIDRTEHYAVDLNKATEQVTFGYRQFITPSLDSNDGVLNFAELQAEFPHLKPNTVYWGPYLPTGEYLIINGRLVKGRMSFFKRLSWQNGQPVSSWEDVIIAVR